VICKKPSGKRPIAMENLVKNVADPLEQSSSTSASPLYNHTVLGMLMRTDDCTTY